MLFLTHYLLNLWDPYENFRNNETSITLNQIISFPIIIILIPITFTVDLILLPFRL